MIMISFAAQSQWPNDLWGVRAIFRRIQSIGSLVFLNTNHLCWVVPQRIYWLDVLPIHQQISTRSIHFLVSLPSDRSQEEGPGANPEDGDGPLAFFVRLARKRSPCVVPPSLPSNPKATSSPTSVVDAWLFLEEDAFAPLDTPTRLDRFESGAAASASFPIRFETPSTHEDSDCSSFSRARKRSPSRHICCSISTIKCC